ncbi:MAG: DUF2752 domain-containing protein [Candidatus Cloacimonetes bacterium]|nr:DUF2752 domain-containing protein [Candidatus Cloacimonadota bacterium]MCB5254288.1 DUF2752 domain-containing protein [Candidatus Cloacimonadota bacterium]MCK9242752.1 DUF2752 domain-containing protein [Candidatus Cloacimonadota bacterium]MDD3104122.1 DUF2752 domain-containing protein [Candidatus Cloacimonadota bacterium]
MLFLIFWTSIAIIALALILLPVESIAFGHNLCIHKAITHKSCPGCGMTRAFASCLQGNIRQAIDYNRLIIIVFPLMVFILLKKLYSDLHRLFRPSWPELPVLRPKSEAD